MPSALSFAFPWAAYFTSEALELSGIVTILFCGRIMAQYTRNCFSDNAKILASQVYKVMEQYVSPEALDAHGKSDYFREANKQLAGFVAGAPEIEIFPSKIKAGTPLTPIFWALRFCSRISSIS